MCDDRILICFQKFVSLIFWTTAPVPIHSLFSCDLLSKICIFDILNNRYTNMSIVDSVVICFQKFVSLIFWTTNNNNVSTGYMLWFAFKNLYLWYSEQQKPSKPLRTLSCDLLSKICIFDILNNMFPELPEFGWLWFAFKNLYLWYSEQHMQLYGVVKFSCDLLSKICIFDILNNILLCIKSEDTVVICFQKFVSLIFWTTRYRQFVVLHRVVRNVRK